MSKDTSSRTSHVSGSIKGKTLILQGHPNADMVMEVENDEWILRHGKSVLLKVAADGDEVLSDSNMDSILEIVKRSIFHSCANFQGEVTINGRLTVENSNISFTNIPIVADPTELLRLYIDPSTVEIVSSSS